MEWSVIATFAGVLVAALGAAWAIVREQSVMRQLERVTAVLKDTPEEGESRAQLSVVRDDLVRRLNSGYRAPRLWASSFGGWTLRIFGAAVIGVGYVYIWIGLNMLMPTLRDPGTYELKDWLTIGVFTVVIGVTVAAAAGLVLRQRTRQRLAWLREHETGESSRPRV